MSKEKCGSHFFPFELTFFKSNLALLTLVGQKTERHSPGNAGLECLSDEPLIDTVFRIVGPASCTFEILRAHLSSRALWKWDAHPCKPFWSTDKWWIWTIFSAVYTLGHTFSCQYNFWLNTTKVKHCDQSYTNAKIQNVSSIDLNSSLFMKPSSIESHNPL